MTSDFFHLKRAFGRANFGLPFQNYSFDELLFGLIFKSDDLNLAAIEKIYPDHVAFYREFKSPGSSLKGIK